MLLTNRVLFVWLVQNTDKCIDARGREYLDGVLGEIAQAMGSASPMEAAESLEKLRISLELDVPEATEEEIDLMSGSVVPVRLRNFPAALDVETIRDLYHRILILKEA